MSNEFDFIVIGNSWVANLMALRLCKKGTCLRVHGNEKLGTKTISKLETSQYLPFSDIDNSCFDFLGVSAESSEAQSLTVESGSLIPFVGFGSKKFPANEYIKAWSSSQWLKLNKNFSTWDAEFNNSFSGELLTGHAVTSVEPVENGVNIAVNGQSYLGKKVFYCDEFGELLKVLPKSSVP